SCTLRASRHPSEKSNQFWTGTSGDDTHVLRPLDNRLCDSLLNSFGGNTLSERLPSSALSKPTGCQVRRASKYQIRLNGAYFARGSIALIVYRIEQRSECRTRDL